MGAERYESGIMKAIWDRHVESWQSAIKVFEKLQIIEGFQTRFSVTRCNCVVRPQIPREAGQKSEFERSK